MQEGQVADYDSLPSAFGQEDRATSGQQRFLITVAAPRRDEIPAGRDVTPYGDAAVDWNPYCLDSTRPIAEHAAALARALGYQPEVGDLHTHAADLLASGSPSAPQLLLIDPWALLTPSNQHQLQHLDGLDTPWLQVIIPWDYAAESPELEGKLRVVLDATLRRKLTEVRATSAGAARGVPDLGDFSMVLPKLILTAVKQYLRNARAFPPSGPTAERPRLSGSLTDRPHVG